MWIKPNAEQSFLYGNHVLKSGLGRVTENVAKYQNVLLCSMSDTPLVRECNMMQMISLCVCVCASLSLCPRL